MSERKSKLLRKLAISDGMTRKHYRRLKNFWKQMSHPERFAVSKQIRERLALLNIQKDAAQHHDSRRVDIA